MAAAAGQNWQNNKQCAQILQYNQIKFAGNFKFPAFLLPALLPKRLVFGKILTGAAVPAQEGCFPVPASKKQVGFPFAMEH